MTIFTLAGKNLRHHLRSYTTYFLSSTFAVWLFYLYTSLLDHPDFAGHVPEDVKTIMRFLAFVVGGFSLLFLLYSHSAFLKARQKELALLSLLGMKPGQIAQTVYAENGLIGLGAIGAGAGLGIVTSKLFYLGLGRVLDLRRPVSFHLSLQALGWTVAMFACVFAVVALYTRWKLAGLPVAELLRDARRPKAAPRFSPWLLGIAFGLMAAAYALALMEDKPDSLFLTYLALVLAGTYLLFTQGSVVVLRWLQRRPSIYYRGTGLVSLSQLVFKVADNARLLFMVSLLTTVVLATLGILYSATLDLDRQALQTAPVALQVMGEPGGVGPERVAQVLAEAGLAPVAPMRLAVTPGDVRRPLPTDLAVQGPVQLAQGVKETVSVMGLSGFNAWQAAFGGEPLDLAGAGQAGSAGVLVEHWPNGRTFPFRPSGGQVSLEGPAGLLPLGEAPLDMRLNSPLVYHVVVLTDEAYAAWTESLGRAGATVLYGYRLADWKASRAAMVRLQEEMALAGSALGGPVGEALTGTSMSQENARQFAGFMLFLGAFVSLLFFLAAGNMLYFKLFTDLYEDRKQFQGLHKVGIRTAEIGRVVSVQTLALFGLPFAVALPNAAVLMTALFSSSKLEVWRPLGTVTVLYLALYGVYYLAARRTFVGAVLERS
jgi:putative ABC transport system permease protein